MRYETADKIGAARRSSLDGSPLNIGTAGVGMNQRQDGLCPLNPVSMRSRQIRSGISRCGEDSKVLRRQGRRHHHYSGFFEDFRRRRAYSEANSANPRANPGVLGQGAGDLR
jgi:hypothetical protein